MNLASLSAHSQSYLTSLSFLLFISLFIIIKSLSRSSHSQMHWVQLTTIPPPFAILECVSITKNQYKQISVCLSTLICISLSSPLLYSSSSLLFSLVSWSQSLIYLASRTREQSTEWTLSHRETRMYLSQSPLTLNTVMITYVKSVCLHASPSACSRVMFLPCCCHHLIFSWSKHKTTRVRDTSHQSAASSLSSIHHHDQHWELISHKPKYCSLKSRMKSRVHPKYLTASV